MIQLRRFFDLTPERITAGYAAFGIVWILVSDQALRLVFEAETVIALGQTLKGWVFVGLSSALIFGLTRVRERQLERSRERAVTATQQLQVLYRLFRHNIRNDMTVVRGFTDLLRDRNTDPAFEPWLRTIRTTVTDIIDMSEKLRIVTTIDIQEPATESVDLVLLLTRELERLKSQYPEVTIDTDLPDSLAVSAGWNLQYAFREVLQNAMEHHPGPPADRRITVRSEQTDRNVTVEIADNGPGIPPEETIPIESGMESQLIHGSGVGLWIIAWLCRSYDGHAQFDSENGTTVSMTFNRADPVETATDRPSPDRHPGPFG